MKKTFTLIFTLLIVIFTVIPGQLSAQTLCHTPSGVSVSGLSQNTAVLSWSGISTTASYNIRYQTAGATGWTFINNVNAPYTLSGLICSGSYIFQVQQVCYGNSNQPLFSDWSIAYNFTTLSCSNTCPAPSGLISTNVSATGAVLKWSATSTVANSFNLRYKKANTETWITLNNVSLPYYQLGNLNCATSYVWQMQQICTSPSGTGVAVLSPWSESATFTTSVCQVNCPSPTGLLTTEISQNGAYLKWNNTTITSSYNLRYRHTASSSWITLNNVTMPYALSNLNCATPYIWQVQQVCQNGSTTAFFSDWSQSNTFYTNACPPSCSVPNGLTTTNISQNGAILHLTSNNNIANTYNLRYRNANTETWHTLTNISFPYQLGGLVCNSNYVWQVQQICNNTSPANVSLWSDIATFTTSACPVICPSPLGLETLNINTNSAVLKWNSTTATANNFNLRYSIGNSGNWVTINNVSSPYQIANLNCNATYVWQVQQICPNTSGTAIASPWSESLSFTTAVCPVICPAPMGLETINISTNSAVLKWNVNGTNSNSFNLRYRINSSATWTTLYNISNPYPLGNLNCANTYEWQVQQNCFNSTNTISVSPWSSSVSFTTASCPVNCPIPTGLTVSNVNPNSVVLQWATSASNPTGFYNLRYRLANSNSWIIMNNVNSPYQLGGLHCAEAYVWQVQMVCASTTGTAIVSPWSETAAFTTNNCQVNCPAPSGLFTTNISSNGAVLKWTSNYSTIPNAFNLRYRMANNSEWIYLNNVSSPYQLTNLNCNTSYVWQAQQVCINSVSPNIVSLWTESVTFTTATCPEICPVPTNMETINVGTNNVVLKWNSSTNTSNSYNLRYRIANSENWITLYNVSSPYQLGSLNCASTYIWQVQQNCNNTPLTVVILSPWSSNNTFTTLSCPLNCPTPTGLLATNISTESAVLKWTSISSQPNSFRIRYRNSNNTVWTTINNVSMPYTLSGLNCNSTYEWQVQQLCYNTPGTFSDSQWSATAIFVTGNCPVICPAPSGLITTNINSNSAVLKWMVTTNISYSYNIRYRLVNSNNWITINNATMPYSLGNLLCASYYVWQVQQICSSPTGTSVAILSPWSESATFNTSNCPDICPAPTGLNVSGMSPHGGILNWNAVNGAAYYIIRYKQINNTASFVTVTSNTNMRQIGGLSANTSYIWQVQAICPNGSTIGSTSAWSVTSEFSTPSSLTAYPNPANRMLNATYWTDNASIAVIELRDMFGKQIYVERRTTVSGNNTFSIDTTGMSDGIYMLNIQNGSNTITSKVLIKH